MIERDLCYEPRFYTWKIAIGFCCAIRLKLLILINVTSRITLSNLTDERENRAERFGRSEVIFLEEISSQRNLDEQRNRGVNFMSKPIK